MDEVTFKWSPDGSQLLIKTELYDDDTGESYYGKNKMLFIDVFFNLSI